MHPLKKPANLSELSQRIQALAVLDVSLRRNLASQVKRFSEIVGQPAELIRCDVETVRELIANAKPGAYGITPAYWSKIRSSVWRCFDLAGFNVLRGTGTELTAELATLLKLVPKHPDWTELTPLLKFLIARNLSVFALNQAHVPEFRDWLKPRYTRVSWSRAMKTALKRWSRCQIAHRSAWPQSPLVPEYEVRDWAPAWSSISALETVVDAHIEDLRRPRKRRHGGFKKSMKESTLKARKAYIRRIAGAIHLATGVMPRTLEEVTRPELVEAGVDFIAQKTGVETSGNLYQLLRHVNSIARHHVARTAEDLEELKHIRRSVAPATGPAEKNRKLLELFRNEALRDKFIEEPGRVLRALQAKQRRTGELTHAELVSGRLCSRMMLNAVT